MTAPAHSPATSLTIGDEAATRRGHPLRKFGSASVERVRIERVRVKVARPTMESE